MTAAAAKHLEQVVEVEQAAAVSLLETVAELAEARHRGEVAKRSGHGGDRDQPNNNAVAFGQEASVMQRYAAAGVVLPTRDEHVDPCIFGVLVDAPFRSGAAVAQGGERSTGGDRGEEPPPVLELRAPHRVDAVMNAMQVAGGDQSRDRRRLEAEMQQLSSGDDPVLPPGYPHHLPPR